MTNHTVVDLGILQHRLLWLEVSLDSCFATDGMTRAVAGSPLRCVSECACVIVSLPPQVRAHRVLTYTDISAAGEGTDTDSDGEGDWHSAELSKVS